MCYAGVTKNGSTSTLLGLKLIAPSAACGLALAGNVSQAENQVAYPYFAETPFLN